MPVLIESLAIADVKLIKTTVHVDERGSFCETWNRRDLGRAGICRDFIQDNHAVSSTAGTIRGLHCQVGSDAQGKLLRVTRGRVFDVAVDLRPASPTFGHWVGKELDSKSGEQIWIPAGFAHGYCTLEPDTEVIYKVDNHYNPAAESGIRWDDPDLGIEWPELAGEPIVAPKDLSLPGFAAWRANAVHRLDQRAAGNYDEPTQSPVVLQAAERVLI